MFNGADVITKNGKVLGGARPGSGRKPGQVLKSTIEKNLRAKQTVRNVLSRA
jgi:hypothetical protein